jgi:hypothetical protein
MSVDSFWFSAFLLGVAYLPAINRILGDFSNFDGIGQVIPNKWFTKKVWI